MNTVQGPMKDRTSLMFHGGLVSLIAATFSALVFASLLVSSRAKNSNFDSLNSHLFGLNVIPLYCSVRNTSCRLLSCSSTVFPCTTISSAMFSNNLVILFWCRRNSEHETFVSEETKRRNKCSNIMTVLV